MSTRLTFTDMHTAGEPVRIVTGGYPQLGGATILEKRRDAEKNHDHLRRAMMLEPRGHAGMYGVIPVTPAHPEAALGVLFTHNAGYSTMCGHATIALGRWIIDQGLVPRREPVTEFILEAPCGPLKLSCTVQNGVVGAVHFESVPAFAEVLGLTVALPDFGAVTCDIGYGGAYYAIIPASQFGLDFFNAPVDALVNAAGTLTDYLRAHYPLQHPVEPDLGFFYGTIITDDAPVSGMSWNMCVFAERQIDRSPTGSGVTARMAVDHAKVLLGRGEKRTFLGITGHPFTGEVVKNLSYAGKQAVTVKVGGRGYYMGQGEFVLEEDDALRHGFGLPARFGDAQAHGA